MKNYLKLSMVTMFFVSTLFLATSLAGASEQRSAHWGGSGGTRLFNFDCGPSGVMIGLVAKWGAWLDQLGIMCRRVGSDGTLGSVFTIGPTGGSGGTTSVTKRCSDGEVIRGFGSYTGSYVNQLFFTCQKWNPSKKQREGNSTIHSVGKWGYGVSENSFGCQGNNYVVKKIYGKSGIYIDRVQIICREWNK